MASYPPHILADKGKMSTRNTAYAEMHIKVIIEDKRKVDSWAILKHTDKAKIAIINVSTYSI